MYIDDYVYDEFLENWLDVYVSLKCQNIYVKRPSGANTLRTVIYDAQILFKS